MTLEADHVPGPELSIAYFVHDLDDAAVHRRVRMLRAETDDIAVIGFRRCATGSQAVSGVVPLELGRTRNAQLIRRIGSVLWAALRLPRMRQAVSGRTVIIARTLEMLALANLARRRYAPSAALVYECLDIHRLMTSPSPAGSALRKVEKSLVSRCGMLVTSSPGFIREYFAPAYRPLPPVWLLENRLLATELAPDALRCREFVRTSFGSGGLPPGPPWRIGWFGIIRCRRSLHILAALARSLPGQIEVVIRGRPSRNVIPDFDELVDSNPGLFFGGPYDRVRDLAGLYADVHFVWTIDYYEADGNSNWLLPNRLYEGLLYGGVPIALPHVETGRWLHQHRCGITVSEPVTQNVAKLLTRLTAAEYAQARYSVAQVPFSDLVDGPEVSAAFAAALGAL